MRFSSRYFWILFLLVWGLGSAAHAQQFVTGPSMGLDDVKSALRNPATISFHRPQIALGAKAHHLGVSSGSGVPLRQGFLAVSTPFLVDDWLGIGGSVRYFDSPIFKKRAFGASVTGRLLRFLSIGARVSALNLAYNRSAFSSVFDPDDLFQQEGTSKTTFSGTVGIFAKPFPSLNLAAGVRNLNQPNITLGGSGFYARREFFAGASYALGAFRARAEVSRGRYGIDVRVGMEAYATDGSYLRVASDASLNKGVVEGQLHVGGPLSVNYQYSLPTSNLRTASSGSHQFSVIYEFGRAPEVPEMPSPPSLLVEADRSKVEPSIEPKLYVASDHNTVQHLEKRIEREINVPDKVLRSLSRRALGQIDSSFATNRGKVKGSLVEQIPENVKVSDVLSASYDSLFTQVRRRLNKGSPSVMKLVSQGIGRIKAFGLYNRLRSEEAIKPEKLRVVVTSDSTSESTIRSVKSIPLEEELSLLNPTQTRLSLLFPYLESEDGIWNLTVENQSGGTVKTFSGTGRPPKEIEWKWTDNQGEPLDQGTYSFQLEWEGVNGRTYRSNEATFVVEKTVRKITIEVTQNPDVLENPADALELRIEK